MTDYLAGMTDRYASARCDRSAVGAAGPRALMARYTDESTRARPRRGRLRRARRRAHGAAPGGRRRATRACARSTTSARRRSASTRSRRSTTASAAARAATCSRSCRRPRAWTSRARWSCSPSATASSSSARTRTRGAAERRQRARAAAASCWSARRPTTCATCGSRARRRARASTCAGRGLEEEALREFRVGYAPSAWDTRADGLAPRRLQRARSCYAAGLAQRSQEQRAAATTASAGGSCSRWPTRAGACSASARGRWRDDQQPKYLNTSDSDVFHKGRTSTAPTWRARPPRKAGAVVLVEGYTDVIALHQAGVRNAVGADGHGADRRAGGRDRPRWRRRRCLPGRGQRGPGVGRRKGDRGAAQHDRAGRTRGVEFRIVRLPAGQDPADVVQHAGAEAMRGAARRAVADRALRGRARARAAGARARTRCWRRSRGVDRAAAGQRAAGRAGPARRRPARASASQNLVNEAPRGGRAGGPAGAAAGRPRRRADAVRRGGRGATAERRGDGPDRRCDAAAAAARAVDPRAALARREQSERAFLALLPRAARARASGAWPSSTSRSYFSAPATPPGRRVPARAPAHAGRPSLPSGDEALARLVAELRRSRAGDLEATPAKLELEALQLDLHRLERHISNARASRAPRASAPSPPSASACSTRSATG